MLSFCTLHFEHHVAHFKGNKYCRSRVAAWFCTPDLEYLIAPVHPPAVPVVATNIVGVESLPDSAHQTWNISSRLFVRLTRLTWSCYNFSLLSQQFESRHEDFSISQKIARNAQSQRLIFWHLSENWGHHRIHWRLRPSSVFMIYLRQWNDM